MRDLFLEKIEKNHNIQEQPVSVVKNATSCNCQRLGFKKSLHQKSTTYIYIYICICVFIDTGPPFPIVQHVAPVAHPLTLSRKARDIVRHRADDVYFHRN